MDTQALRTLVDATLEAQRVYEAAEANLNAAALARSAALDRIRHEIGNLDHMLAGASVIYGDRVLSVVPGNMGLKLLKTSPLIQYKVVVPPSVPEAESPLPEQLAAVVAASSPVKSQPEPVKPSATAPTPTSGGTIPPLGKKGSGQR